MSEAKRETLAVLSDRYVAQVEKVGLTIKAARDAISRLSDLEIRLLDNNAYAVFQRLRNDNDMLLELLTTAKRLYSTNGLLAQSPECGPWINATREALARGSHHD